MAGPTRAGFLPMESPIDRPLTARERAAVLARIQALIDFWNIRQDELEGPSPEPPAAASAAPRIKYRHPVTGDTWDGNGEHPEWLRHALLKEGLRVDDLKPPHAEDDGLQPPAQ